MTMMWLDFTTKNTKGTKITKWIRVMKYGI